MQRQIFSQISVLTVAGISVLGSCLDNSASAQTSRRGKAAPVQDAPAREIRFDSEVTFPSQLDEFRLHAPSRASQAKLTSLPQPTVEMELPKTVSQDRQPAAASSVTEIAGVESKQEQDEKAIADEGRDSGTIEEVENNSSSSLAPVQTRKLNTKITAVTTSQSGIGTGLVPETDAVASALVGLPTGLDRGVPFRCVHWQPSLISHRPLYFEDAMLERNGHRHYGCLQPLASGAKFFTTITLMPYLHTLRPPHSCVYDYGYSRPGSCAPVLHDTVPYDKHAAVAKTLAMAGFFWAAPL